MIYIDFIPGKLYTPSSILPGGITFNAVHSKDHWFALFHNAPLLCLKKPCIEPGSGSIALQDKHIRCHRTCQFLYEDRIIEFRRYTTHDEFMTNLTKYVIPLVRR